MNYTSKDISIILSGSETLGLEDYSIEEVSIDTRTVATPEHTLFFALSGEMNDGHNFIEAGYAKGIRNFVIHESYQGKHQVDANYFVVENVLEALQKLATHHRQSFPGLKKIGITGSNGKTIIKEWLYQMLFDVYPIVKSPKSYNSQIGMALSLMGIDEHHELGIFEAGISQNGEMITHLKMLNPDIGMITNIGSAHDEGFTSKEEKLEEKLVLFRDTKTIIYCKDHSTIDAYINAHLSEKNTISWGSNSHADIQVEEKRIIGSLNFFVIKYKGESVEVKLRFSDEASFENCMHCIALMCHLTIPLHDIAQRVSRISGLHMRMEMTRGLYKSIIVNDAYSADLDSLQIALEFINQQSGNRKKLAILSAFDQSGQKEAQVFEHIIHYLESFGFSELIYFSKQIFTVSSEKVKVTFFTSKDEFFKDFLKIDLRDKIILIKGARHYELEEISDRLSEKSHSATLQINLSALEQNLRTYKSLLSENTGIIAVVKASAYGSGSAEVARTLQRNNVGYLAVAFADEGIALRQAGIETRIMVFNPDLSSLPDIIRYDLEPEVYGFDQLNQIVDYTEQNKISIPIHLKLDTGMHRLGFQEDDMESLCLVLKAAKHVKVHTIFSHLASSEDESDDAYSQMQFDTFEKMYANISNVIGEKPKRHILNSGGISRFPNRQYDFVRLGIGMYGIDSNPNIQSSLRKVHALFASIIQIKNMKAGDSIGYNRKTILSSDTRVGIVNIGYADGLMRNLGNGNYSFKIQGQDIGILGNVCMDLTIVDLNMVPGAKVGDQVVLFDNTHPIEVLASSAGTIPYEILSRISSRVNRKFLRE